MLRDAEAGNRVVGWAMKPEEAALFFKSLRKQAITLAGYSSEYEDKNAMLEIVKETLAAFSPKTHLVNIGVTIGGIGAAYPLAKSMGFITTGIVSSVAVDYADEISADVDHICFIADQAWGGKVIGGGLSPTSQAMVACTDIMIGIGGGEISRDELLAFRELGKPMRFHPAEINHAWAIQRAQRLNQPPPVSFLGAAHVALLGDGGK
jgi:hypothetical protein